MMFFVYHLQTYSPKNRAWKKVIVKRMQYTASLIDNDRTIRIEAHVISGGCPDTVFFLDICKVRSIYQFSEKANMLEQKGGENG